MTIVVVCPIHTALHIVCIMVHVTGVESFGREELIQPKFSALDAFEFPELHDESVPTTNFFRHLTRLMVICGVRDFSLSVSDAHRLSFLPQRA